MRLSEKPCENAVEKLFLPIVGPKLSVVVSFGFFFGGVTCACRREGQAGCAATQLRVKIYGSSLQYMRANNCIWCKISPLGQIYCTLPKNGMQVFFQKKGCCKSTEKRVSRANSFSARAPFASSLFGWDEKEDRGLEVANSFGHDDKKYSKNVHKLRQDLSC